jgi:hypothetical protein
MSLILYFVMQFMIIGSIKLVQMVVHKYQRQYGPTNLTNVIKDITQNIM